MTAHHFTVDVEEYFHPTAMATEYPSHVWDDLPRRSPAVVGRLLELLSRHGVRATFFVLGWLAEREPRLVEELHQAGHEVGSHGFEHKLVGSLGRSGFRESVRRSKAVLEDRIGVPVSGYRAPSFSIVPGLEWAFDVLLEEGYRYDASLFPVRQHPTYGYPDAHVDPHWIDRADGRIAEFPATTAKLLGMTVPAAGGAYFRLLPYGLVRAGLSQAAGRSRPGTFYIHPWELDDWAPTVSAHIVQRVRTFGGRRRIWERLEKLLTEFRFRPMQKTLDEMQAHRL